MLPKDMWNLLISHPVYVLALGDPFQLPPVDKTQANPVLDNPHVFLDEVMRQAQDSEIIQLSMHVRAGLPISTFKGNGAQVKIFSPRELSVGMLEWADQVLCATNDNRNEINRAVRAARGYGEEPIEGDKVIGLTNHWSFMSSENLVPLTNGQIGTLKDCRLKKKRLPNFIAPDKTMATLYSTVEIENDAFIEVPIDYYCLKTGKATLTDREQFLVKKYAKKCRLTPMFDFAYAYAITCHKAQGSEWSKVLVIEERYPFEKEEHQRWLYTACTRASEKLVLITKD